MLLSLQAVPAGAVWMVHPVAGAQPATWHWPVGWGHVGAPEPMHLPVASHVSVVVQALPSLQGAPRLTVFLHAPLEHESVVQGFLSSQSLAAVQPPAFPPPPPEPVMPPEPPEPPPVPVVPPVAGAVHVPHTPVLQLAIFPPVQVVEQSVPSNLFVN